jgi:PAS domain S-box-containing protein
MAAAKRSELCAPELPGLRAELLFTLLAENVREYAVFLLDADGVIRCWGEGARLMKWWTAHQAEGAHLRLLYPDGGAEDGTAEEHLQTAAASGEYTGEGHRVRSDGSTFWAGVTLSSLRNAGGELVGFTKVTRDFSARRAVEASLAAQAQSLPQPPRLDDEVTRARTLIASVSHELRTPLNAMLGYVALLEHMITDTQQRDYIVRLQRSGRHLVQIVNDILDMSGDDTAPIAMSRAVRRLGAAVQESLADIQAQARDSGVEIVNAMSGTAGDVAYFGDEGRVRQILVNLLTNALKFTGERGRITVSGGAAARVAGAALTGPGPWAYVRVEDNGRGIPDDMQAAIFEPFQQSDETDRHQGSGLGLAISRRLARVMGGDLTVQSAVGVGSVFTLWLPIAPSHPVPR